MPHQKLGWQAPRAGESEPDAVKRCNDARITIFEPPTQPRIGRIEEAELFRSD